jgi:hypothetical protein
MKDILLIYRGKVIDTEIKPKLEEFKYDRVILVVEDEITKNVVNLILGNRTNLTLMTSNNFLDDNNIILKFMKFDVIVGNPPYQNTESESDAGKLYIDITKKSLSLLKPNGIINFLTPDTIVRDGRNKFSIKQTGLKYVDYTANDFFKEGVTIINWEIDKNYTNTDIKITNADGSIDIRNISESLVDKKDIVGVNLFERLKLEKSKLFIIDQSAKNILTTFVDGLYKVYLNVNKNKIGYTNVKPKLYGRKKLVISMSSSYKKELVYESFDDFGELHVMIDITDYTEYQINNIKNFLFNPICIQICNKYKKLYKKGFNSMVYVFPKIDVNKEYSTDDVKSLFNLSDNDMNYLLSND